VAFAFETAARALANLDCQSWIKANSRLASVNQAAFSQDPLIPEYGIGDCGDMGIDTLEIAQDIEVERGGLEAIHLAITKAAHMIGGGALFEVADVDLRFDQLAGKFLVT
jgi:hypothetical protein